MWMWLTRTSVTPLRKQPKRLSHAGIKITIFRVGMQSVNPSIKPFCCLLRETTSLAVITLLAKLDRKRRDRWSEAVRSIDFSHSSRKAWSILNNLTVTSLRHSPRHCPVSANAIASQLEKIEVAELKMVRWALGVTRKDKIRNEYMRGTAKIAKLRDKLQNARLRWYGHVKRREEDYVRKRMMEMAVPGIRKRGRPRRSWMDLVREDMERVGAREGDEVDRVNWRLLSRCGDPERGEAERRRRRKKHFCSSLKS